MDINRVLALNGVNIRQEDGYGYVQILVFAGLRQSGTKKSILWKTVF